MRRGARSLRLVTGISSVAPAGPGPWRFGFLQVTGGRLAYHRTGGEGPALVLCHGLTDNGLCWSRLAAALAPEFDVVMLDARGHGGSSRICIGEPYEAGTDIAEAIDRLGLKAPFVMGHSVGARAAADFAAACPAGVSKVILEDPPFLPLAEKAAAEARREKFRRQVDQFQSMSETDITAMGKASSPLWHEVDLPAWAAAKKQVDPEAFPLYAARWQDAVARITAPTLLIYGEADQGGIVTPDMAEEACSLNPKISAVQIRGAGHNIRRENFPDLLSAVRTFLRA